MATTGNPSIYGGGAQVPSGGLNPAGFKPLGIQSNDPMSNFLHSMANQSSAQGAQSVGQGQAVFGQGVGALGPLVAYLSSLTRGDQGDIQQATQSQTNQIRDAFSAARNMISQQPRGGGKTSALAEAGFGQERQVGDTQSQARLAGAGQLGTVANLLASLGLGQSQFGGSQQEQALKTALQQREQNVQADAATKQMVGQIVGSLVGGAADVGAASIMNQQTPPGYSAGGQSVGGYGPAGPPTAGGYG